MLIKVDGDSAEYWDAPGGRLATAFSYVVAGVLACLLIVTIPFGIACFRLAGFALWPFGRTVVDRPGAGVVSGLGNVLWFVLIGWWLARLEYWLSESGWLRAWLRLNLLVSIVLTIALVSLRPVAFETATILSVAALTNTGHLAEAIPLTPVFDGSAGIAGAPWQGWAGLAPFTKGVLAAAMVAGRLEMLAILALLSPGAWRR